MGNAVIDRQHLIIQQQLHSMHDELQLIQFVEWLGVGGVRRVHRRLADSTPFQLVMAGGSSWVHLAAGSRAAGVHPEWTSETDARRYPFRSMVGGGGGMEGDKRQMIRL